MLPACLKTYLFGSLQLHPDVDVGVLPPSHLKYQVETRWQLIICIGVKDLPHKSRRKTHGHFCRLVCLRWKNIPLSMCSFRCSLSLCIAHVVGWLVWINICHPNDKSTISNQLTTLSYVHLLKTYLANYYSTMKKQITITAIWGRLHKMFINTVGIPISEQLLSLTIHRFLAVTSILIGSRKQETLCLSELM